jgi:hypothetical protein
LARSSGLEATDLLAAFPNAGVSVESATCSPGKLRDLASELLVSDPAVNITSVSPDGSYLSSRWMNQSGKRGRCRPGVQVLHPFDGLGPTGLAADTLFRSRRRDLCLAPLLPLTSHATRSFLACALQACTVFIHAAATGGALGDLRPPCEATRPVSCGRRISVGDNCPDKYERERGFCTFYPPYAA